MHVVDNGIDKVSVFFIEAFRSHNKKVVLINILFLFFLLVIYYRRTMLIFFCVLFDKMLHMSQVPIAVHSCSVYFYLLVYLKTFSYVSCFIYNFLISFVQYCLYIDPPQKYLLFSLLMNEIFSASVHPVDWVVTSYYKM